jgi:hypothetical protein
VDVWDRSLCDHCTANVLNKLSQTTDKGWSTCLGVGRRAKTRRLKKTQITTNCLLYGVSELAGCCEHGNEPSFSIKGGEFLDQLGDC